jgi:hypothetical protein
VIRAVALTALLAACTSHASSELFERALVEDQGTQLRAIVSFTIGDRVRRRLPRLQNQRDHLLCIDPMMKSLVLLFLAACSSDIPGDADTYVINGEPQAGYAWSGPSSYCCNGHLEDLAAWQIWFTNTEQCPTSNADIVGVLDIISPETVQRPSTELPALTSTTLEIILPDAHEWMQEVAELGVKGENGPPSGTLEIGMYSAEEITGTVRARAPNIDGTDMEIVGAFDAHRCDRIHD